MNSVVLRRFSKVVRHAQKYNLKDVPGPPQLPIIGHLHLFSKNGRYSFERINKAWTELHDEHGQIVRLKVGQDIVSTTSPEDTATIFQHQGSFPARPAFGALLKYRKKRHQSSGIITGFGSEWARLRSGVNWMLRPKSPEPYFEQHVAVAEDFAHRVSMIRNPQLVVDDFLPQLYLFTQEAIGVIVFGCRLGTFNDSQLGTQVIHHVDNFLISLCSTLLGFPWWKIFNTNSYKKLESSLDFFNDLCLERMGDASSSFIQKLQRDENLSEKDVIVLMQEIFMAGIDATGNALGFLLYHLSTNQKVQEKLHQEISTLFNNDEFTFDGMKKLTYLNACIKESFRITPTAGGNARILATDAVLSGYRIPAGTLCMSNSPVIGMCEHHFEKPGLFQPERWLRSDDSNRRLQDNIHPYTMLPFGHGVRKCVGQRFAEQEMKLCIIMLLKRFKIYLEGEENLGVKTRMQLMPDKPLSFKFRNRNLTSSARMKTDLHR